MFENHSAENANPKKDLLDQSSSDFENMDDMLQGDLPIKQTKNEYEKDEKQEDSDLNEQSIKKLKRVA